MFQKRPGIKIFWILGVSRFFVSFFVLTIHKIFVGNLEVFHYFRVLKTFRHFGGISRFSLEFFCLTVQKIFVGETFCVSETFCYQLFFWIKGVSRFCWFFLSHGTEAFLRRTNYCFTNLEYRGNLCIRKGLSRFSVADFLSHSTKNNVGEPFCFSEPFKYYFFVDDMRYCEFLSNSLCLTVPKHFVGEPFSVSLSPVNEKL